MRFTNILKTRSRHANLTKSLKTKQIIVRAGFDWGSHDTVVKCDSYDGFPSNTVTQWNFNLKINIVRISVKRARGTHIHLSYNSLAASYTSHK